MALTFAIGDSREVEFFKKYKKSYLILSDLYGPIG